MDRPRSRYNFRSNASESGKLKDINSNDQISRDNDVNTNAGVNNGNTAQKESIALSTLRMFTEMSIKTENYKPDTASAVGTRNLNRNFIQKDGGDNNFNPRPNRNTRGTEVRSNYRKNEHGYVNPRSGSYKNQSNFNQYSDTTTFRSRTESSYRDRSCSSYDSNSRRSDKSTSNSNLANNDDKYSDITTFRSRTESSYRDGSCYSYDTNSRRSDKSTSNSVNNDDTKQSWKNKPLKFKIAKPKSKRNTIDEDDYNFRVRFVGYNTLNEYLKTDSSDLFCKTMRNNSEFEAFLKEPDLENEMIFKMMTIINKLCSLPFKANKAEFIGRICNTEFVRTLSIFIGDVLDEETLHNDMLIQFFKDIADFLTATVDSVPSIAHEKKLDMMLKKTIRTINDLNDKKPNFISDDVVSKLKDSCEKLTEYSKNWEQITANNNNNDGDEKQDDQVKKKYNYKWEDNELPPEDFRELPLYPIQNDLKNENMFLRRNKIEGSYIDVEHYLDVQFRLLREDVIGPIRNGIQEYITALATSGFHKSKKMTLKCGSIRIIRKVKFLAYQMTKNNEVGYLVDFGDLKINWDYSKRFMFGSLLLFTRDHFKTFFLGVVLDRKVENLKKGLLLVSIIDQDHLPEDIFMYDYLMAESEVYYEPYYLVLKSLTRLNASNFPLTDYIVSGVTERLVPSYVFRFGGSWQIYDKKALVNYVDCSLQGAPSAEELGLDEAQYDAFTKALTSKFCVIQGPPGTGKTFIGLKIVEVMLDNMNRFRQIFKTPILVVCYTNHALDQFLEGILKYTTNIVRAGSQSKNENLANYNLRGSMQLEKRRNAQRNIGKVMSDVRREVQWYILQMKLLSNANEQIDSRCGVLQLKYLNLVMTNDERSCFNGNDLDLWRWLLPYCDEDYEEVDSDDDRPVISRVTIMNREEKLFDEGIDYPEDDDEDYRLVDEEEFGEEVVQRQKNDGIYYRTLDTLEEDIKVYQSEKNKLKARAKNNRNLKLNGNYWVERYNLNKKICVSIAEFNHLEDQCRENRYDPNFQARNKPLNLPLHHRWSLYWTWVDKLKKSNVRQLNEFQRQYQAKKDQYEEFKQTEDFFVVKAADVVGMTTTCAARLNLLLQNLGCKIVIIEEAAEVLESHIVTSLTKDTEHVILIGDHKQLKPSAAVYKLCAQYKFDVSLFERMINNGMYCPTLIKQHRMRPEIASLIAPLIYPNLQNAENVMGYEEIKGVKKSLYFFEHNNFETEVQDSSSRKNVFEADFAVNLARHLILQGYRQDQITILTAYTGQMFLIRQKKKDHHFCTNIRCIVVDKYQGEESDIIILSLVRSNEESRIGFLGMENRICVALSRSKMGLYIIGNMDNLCHKSEIWQNIRANLQSKDATGRKLILYCKKHDKEIEIESPDDFKKSPQGGCDNYCGDQLDCGHNCLANCHPIDMDHQLNKCFQKCSRLCPKLHACPKKCFETCGNCQVVESRQLKCGHTAMLACHVEEANYKCEEKVEDTSPHCEHSVMRFCWQTAAEAKCEVKCETRLDCGHSCVDTCHVLNDPEHENYKCRKDCERNNVDCSRDHKCNKLCFEDCGKCLERVMMDLPCGHKFKLPCSTDVDEVKCPKTCKKPCPDCGKLCRRSCCLPCAPCPFKVTKTIPECGHKVEMECGENPERRFCKSKCQRVLACGHKCKGLCSKDCKTINCTELVKIVTVKGLCGHEFVNLPCHKRLEYVGNNVNHNEIIKLLPNCDEKCGKILDCEHNCSGNCNHCWQGRLHRKCQQKCGRTLICGHSCTSPCPEFCPPCEEKCFTKCKHSSCKKKCGIPCTNCQEKCDWGCVHSKCTKKCFQKCDRKACSEPCLEKFECGHPCVGFCGDPCPPCKTCNPDMYEIFFGDEDEEDRRFVLLEDCQHPFESEGLEKFLQMDVEGKEIVMKCCPLCKTPITTTMRYMNYIKETNKDILAVKKRIYGDNPKAKLAQQRDECNKFEQLVSFYARDFATSGFDMLKKNIDNIIHRIGVPPPPKGKPKNYHPKPISTAELTSLSMVRSIYSLFSNFLYRFQDTKLEVERRPLERLAVKDKQRFTEMYNRSLDYAKEVIRKVMAVSSKIDKQQFKDFNDELSKFAKMIDYCTLLCDPKLVNVDVRLSVDKICAKIDDELYGPSAFTEAKERIIDALFEEYQKQVKSDQRVGLSPAEKAMINAAMSRNFHSGSGKGHWYKCPNGHMYCITECGGATVQSVCPECRAPIGGGNHALLLSNSHAPEMDGSTRPAWPTVANF